MNFNTLYSKARKNQVMIQKRAEFDAMTDGLTTVQNNWHRATVEELKSLKEYGGRVNPDRDTIYTHVSTYRLKVLV